MFYSRFLQSVELWPDAVAVENSAPACCRQPEPVEHLARPAVPRVHGTATPTASFGNVPSRLAHGCSAPGSSRGARCAVLANNSPDWVAVYLGIVAAGHTAVPLDTAFNGEQVEKLLRDCGASLIFADAKHLPIAQHAGIGHQLKVALIDEPSVPRQPELPGLGEMYLAGADGFTPSSKPEDVACILYTSGTTSDPKGVMLTHANLRGEMDWSLLRTLRLHGRNPWRAAALPRAGADGKPHAAAGLRAVPAPESLNTTELLRALSERNITLFCCVPQFFYLIHERVFQEARKRGTIAWNAFRTMMALSRAGRSVGLNPGKIFFQNWPHPARAPEMRYLSPAVPASTGDRA